MRSLQESVDLRNISLTICHKLECPKLDKEKGRSPDAYFEAIYCKFLEQVFISWLKVGFDGVLMSSLTRAKHCLKPGHIQ